MQTWGQAMSDALYGPDGFYRRHRPAEHFRTSVSASPHFATALVPLVRAVDDALGRPARLDIVDVGAGDGRFLDDLLAALPDDVGGRAAAVAVDVRPRPPELVDAVGWTTAPPTDVTGLVVAFELLDNVPCDVVERDDAGTLRQVEVDRETGEESLGAEATDDQRAWIDAWWPLSEPGDRAEVGARRDDAWAELVRSLRRGVALAVDYGHLLADRTSGVVSGGTLTGYRDGRQVVPVPDGSCDITAHVAFDACAAAGESAGAESTVLTTQARSLRGLGIDTTRPPLALASTDPLGYVQRLSDVAAASELLDPGSLGSFLWLMQAKGCSPRVSIDPPDAVRQAD